jgi:hypothetical protein
MVIVWKQKARVKHLCSGVTSIAFNEWSSLSLPPLASFYNRVHQIKTARSLEQRPASFPSHVHGVASDDRFDFPHSTSERHTHSELE